MIKPAKTVAAVLAALFPNSEKAISEKLTQEEFDAFAADAQETQNRLDAQEQGNTAITADLATANASLEQTQATLTQAQADLTKANADLATANTTVAELTPKATAWDAHQAALKGANVIDDSTNKGKGKPQSTGLSEKDQASLEEKQRLAAKYPGLMADLGIPAATEE
jgi:septal ring factor EnvC (AmiA/AmiB activator)